MSYSHLNKLCPIERLLSNGELAWNEMILRMMETFLAHNELMTKSITQGSIECIKEKERYINYSFQ